MCIKIICYSNLAFESGLGKIHRYLRHLHLDDKFNHGHGPDHSSKWSEDSQGKSHGAYTVAGGSQNKMSPQRRQVKESEVKGVE